MPTASTIDALNVYAAVFQTLGTLPVRWEKSTKKFIYRLNHRELLLWYFNATIELFATLCCGLICLREVFVKVTNITTHALVIQMLFGLLGVAGCGSNLLVLIYGQVETTAWDNICFIENMVTNGN